MPTNLYDDLDLLYREIWGQSLHHGVWITRRETIDEARENLIEIALNQLEPKGTIADVGCGYGTLANRLVERFRCKVLANTNSTKQAARISPRSEIKILEGDWLEQKLKPESLDGVIAIESLSHFGSFEKFLKHTIPVLKPGGRIVICDWYSETGSCLLLRRLAATGNIPPWRSAFSLSSEAQNLNLRKLHTIDLSKEVSPTWSALFRQSVLLPFRAPGLLSTLLRKIVTRPSLLVIFPLIRLAYETGDLQYQVICFEK